MGELLTDAATQAKQALAPALAALREIAEDQDGPTAARVQAARSVVGAALKLTEITEVLRRVADLEKAMAEAEAWKG